MSLIYERAYYEESFGGMGAVGLRIDLATGVDLKSEGMQKSLRDAAEIISKQIKRQLYASSDEAIRHAKLQEEGITALFSAPIYIEKIPNGYCNDSCCEHLPWFVVTTKIGRITIGWRKRVLSIDWSQTPAASAAELFPNKNVTKGEKSIHAWSYEDARKYLKVILEGKPL